MTRQLFSWISLLALGLSAIPARAQVAADGTLNTQVTPTGAAFNITGGTTTSGNNLFHSFSQFSIPTGGSVLFDNAANIANIFSRVTGNSISNIDGLLQTSGSANLFLLNPNGIIFGPNARLNIDGSFTATTADSILFNSGFAFSASNPQTPPLLGVNVPVGLQFAGNPGAIAVQGTGHNLTRNNSFVRPIERSGSVSGLRVDPGRTLALIGGDLNFEGGVVTADSGRIELGSVNSGVVGLNSTPQGLTFNYNNVQNFRDINLAQRSLADTSGTLGGGSIQLQARRVILNDGSTLLQQNFSSQPAGPISIFATESVDSNRPLRVPGIANAIINETLGTGEGGNIEIFTPRLTLDEGDAIIMTRTLSSARGGDIFINAPDLVQVVGELTPAGGGTSSIVSAARGSGDGGNITLSTNRLRVNGGNISTPTLGAGNSGNLTVNAARSVDVRGGLLAVSTFSTGDAGQLTVNTRNLRLTDGGRISSSTISSGTAGNIFINASGRVSVSGRDSVSSELSRIKSTADIPSPAIQQALGLPPSVDGVSGDVTINTPILRVANGAEVSVSNEGSAPAGSLNVNANFVVLNREGKLLAATASGEGGNINLQVRDVLSLRNQSLISATAGGTGNGGNINIATRFIVAANNSDIVANAFEGNGGNITISARGIFGTEFRPQLTPESDITASSEFGVDGIVRINNLNFSPRSEAAQLPEDVSDPSQDISSGCAAVARDNRFTVIGRGGLPPNPNEGLRSDRVWSDVRDLSTFRSSQQVKNESISTHSAKSPVDRDLSTLGSFQQVKNESISTHSAKSPVNFTEATGWVVNEAGQVELVTAVSSGDAIASSVNCLGGH
ncbi:MAG: filamentous hemagglutinin N-terminal domain-containing protein [Cyanobacteriota bacterium]|nr:filamentous hemagglutinin N-terminal domain-containing protein [Cyanobacteriota bacterium]